MADPYCKSCPARFGSNDCQCSRDYTRQLALWMWNSLCSRIRAAWAAIWRKQ